MDYAKTYYYENVRIPYGSTLDDDVTNMLLAGYLDKLWMTETNIYMQVANILSIYDKEGNLLSATEIG